MFLACFCLALIHFLAGDFATDNLSQTELDVTVIPELQTLENQLAGGKAGGSCFFWTQVSPSKSNPALAYSLPCYCSRAPFEPYGMARVPSPGHARQNEHI